LIIKFLKFAEPFISDNRYSNFTKGVDDTLAVFYDKQSKESLALRGDYTNIDLVKKNKYYVTFLRNTRILMDIRAYKKN